MPLPIAPGATADELLYDVAVLTLPPPYQPVKFLVSLDYREQGTNDTDGDPPGGSTAAGTVIVAGEDAADFWAYFLGFSERNGPGASTLTRHLPHALLYYDHLLWARRLSMSDFKRVEDVVPAEAALYGWPEFDWIKYRAEWTDRPYEVLPDDALEAAVPETDRYVERYDLPQARERKVPSWQVETAEGAMVTPTSITGGVAQPLGEVGFVIDRTAQVEYVWHQIPEAVYPRLAVGGLTGLVNQAAFDANYRNYPAGTLLFEGPAERPIRHRMRNGRLAVTVRYQFRYRPDGWNYYRKPDTGSLVPWRVTGTTRPVYDAGDFDRLFRPEG